MATRSPSDLKKLLSTSEYSLFQSSHGESLSKATAAAIGAAVVRARALRDKWQDQFRKQQRTKQAAIGGRGTGGNDRSLEKIAIFAEAVSRFEARLAELGATAAAAVTAGRKKLAPTSSARTQAHRAARAQTRAALAEHTTVTAGRKITTAAPSKVKAKGQPAIAAQAEPVVKAAKVAKTAKKKTASGRAASKKRLRGAAPAAAVVTTGKKPFAVDPLRQVKVATKLKANRVRIAGIDTRGRAHSASQVRRKQGRRDARGRS
jgi:hypothetical protein